MENKKLSELFQLSTDLAEVSDAVDENLNSSTVNSSAMSNLEKIEKALPLVRGLELTDDELDELSTLAVSGYKDLIDLAMQSDSRFSSEILAVASTMLGHAITATSAKHSKKFKILEMQLKFEQLRQKMSEQQKEVDAIPVGQGQALDRNEILKMMNSKSNANSSKNDK